jgi:hypothetical protein
VRVPSTLLGNLSKLTDVLRWITRIALAVNGNINFGSTMSNTDADENMNCWKATGTSPAAPNTDFTITHSLSDGNGQHRIPITIVGQDTNNGGLLYRSPVTAWTKTTITLRCTTASAAYNVIVS